MKIKSNFLKTFAIGALACICSAVMATGVFAALTHRVEITSTVTFGAFGVGGTIYAKTTGAQTNQYFNRGLTNNVAGNNDNPYVFDNENSLPTSWNIGNLLFDTVNASTGAVTDVQIIFGITNTGDNAMAVGLSGLAGLTTQSNIVATYTVSGAVTVSTTTLPGQIYLEIPSAVSANQTATITINLHVQDTNISTSPSSFNLSLNIAKTDNSNWKTVTLVANDGASPATPNKTIKAWTGTNVAFPANAFLRSGCNLTGFFTASTGGTMIAKASGELVQQSNAYVSYSNNTATWIGTSDATLYAQWEAPWTAMGTYTSGGSTNWEYDSINSTINYPTTALNGYTWVTFDDLTGITMTATSTWTRWIIIGGGSDTYKPDSTSQPNLPTNAFSTSQVDDLESNQLLLLSERNLNDSYKWENDLDGYVSTWDSLQKDGTDNIRYRCENYYDTTLKTKLGTSIVPQTMKTCDYSHGGDGGGTVQTSSQSDPLFLLATNVPSSSSYSEYNNQNYIIENYLRQGARIGYQQDGSSACCFWLRSGVCSNLILSYLVYNDGYIRNDLVSYDIYGTRVAFVLSLPSDDVIAFNANEGTGSVDINGIPQDVEIGDVVTLPSGTGLTKTGYTFAGWNTSADGTGITYQPGTTFVIPAHTTLYAKWELPYTIYAYQNSTGSGRDTSTLVSGVTTGVNAPNEEWNGYYYLTTNRTASGNKYASTNNDCRWIIIGAGANQNKYFYDIVGTTLTNNNSQSRLPLTAFGGTITKGGTVYMGINEDNLGADELMLLSEQTLFLSYYDNQGSKIAKWGDNTVGSEYTCQLNSILNPSSNTGFYENAGLTNLYNMIQTKSLSTSYYNEGIKTTTSKIFVLATEAGYTNGRLGGFITNGAQQNYTLENYFGSAYAWSLNDNTPNNDKRIYVFGGSDQGCWWLRSGNADYTEYSYFVLSSRVVSDINVYYSELGVRPTFVLELS